MAFDDRHTDVLVTVGVAAVTIAVALPSVQRLGCHGWSAVIVSVGCVLVVLAVLVVGSRWVGR